MFYIVLLATSIFLTYCIKQYAIKKSIVDIPNERSSHTVPTPRGGGLAIVATFYLGISYLYYINNINQQLFLLLLTSLPIVIISFIDDLLSVSAKIRFLIQLLSAIFAIYILGGVNEIDFIIFYSGFTSY